MLRLYDPARHETLSGAAWSDGAARAAIRRIADDALAAFDESLFWPAHPADDPVTPDERFASLYLGAAGMIWALRHLAQVGAVDASRRFDAAVAALVERHHAWANPEPGQSASFLLGDSGLLLLQWQFVRDAGTAQRLYELVEGNLDHPAREPLWGSPGSAIAAVHMAEASGQARWAALVQRAVQRLVDTLQTDPDTGTPIWQQDLYGRSRRFLGAGHGLAGNAYLALRAARFVEPALRQQVIDAALATLQTTALRDGDAINWHPISDAERVVGQTPLVQDCHGAPGIVCRLAGVGRDPAWDELLLGAGELTWRAGPLAKGPGLCHGTAGNALALLKLARRHRDERWLERARAMAMHAVGQCERQRAEHGRGRYSLWTGDVGLACVLWNCIVASDALPTMDVF